MSAKKKEAPQPPSLDSMTLRDLASLFAMNGLLSCYVNQPGPPNMDRLIEFADEAADVWVARRAKQ